jgi:hypothetical protein
MSSLQAGELSPSDAIDIIALSLRDNLERFNVPINIQNAGQVANILSAQLLPKSPLSRFVLTRLKSDKLPEFSFAEAESHALERGVAVIAINIQHGIDIEAPHAAAAILLSKLRELGHLPSSSDIKEI